LVTECHFSYNSYGNLTSFTDVEGNTTLYEHDLNHIYLTSITNALNQTIEVTYDFHTGWLTSIKDLRGNTVSYEYDIIGRVTKKIHPDLTESEAVYDDQNNCVTVYDELDHKTINYYDGLGRLIKTEKYLFSTSNLTETFTYTYLNKVKTHTNPGGHTYTYEYDSKGRPTKIINPDFTYKKIHFDDNLNIISFIDENGHQKEYHRDRVGNVLWVKEYTDQTTYYMTEYTYDNIGNMTSFTDANGNTTYYENSLFGITQTIYPDLTTETFSYDGIGNILQKTDSNGTITYTYNAVYQLIGVQYPDHSITFEYDSNGNRIRMTDPQGDTSYNYDSRNRLLSETRAIEGELYTVGYTYDAASRLISVTYPDQTVITYEYDALNRLIAIPGYAEFTYDANSHLETMTYSNGVSTTYEYDSCSRNVTIHAQKNDIDLLLLHYQYDPVGNITQMDYGRRLADQQWVQSAEIFQYDWLNRLVTAEGNYGLLSYAYDPVGNRSSSNGVTYTYNTMNELISRDGTTFTYDDKGNMTEKSNDTNTWLYTYDMTLLTQVEKNQHTRAQYTYDGDGKRIKKTEWIESLQEYQTKVYVYSGIDIIYEKNVNTGCYTFYVYGPDGRIAKTVDGLTEYYHADRLGSTRLITDESGNTVADVSYAPFGESVATGEEEYLYTGKEKDVTGLYYFGARYYDPELGRFITRDVVRRDTKNPQSLNWYVYCLNNPIRYVDPLGFQADDASEIIEEIFSLLQNMSLGDLDEEIETLLEEKSPFEVLVSLVEKLGLSYTVDYEKEEINITIEAGGLSTDIVLSNDPTLGLYGHSPPGKGIINVNAQNHGTAGDLVATILHEMCHCVLDMTKIKLKPREEETLILSAQLNAMNNFIDPKTRSPNLINARYPFSDKYYSDQKRNLDLYSPKDDSKSGICSGSIVLNLFVFLGLFLIETFKREEI
jgi:RHS repeat-associated protein